MVFQNIWPVVFHRLLWGMAFCPAWAESSKVEFFVSPTGNDAGPGSRTEPFGTIQRGLLATRQATGAQETLYLHGGIYELDSPVVLGPGDEGLNIQALDPKNPPRLIGGRVVKSMHVLEDEATLMQFPAVARGKIQVADLKDGNIEDYGSQKSIGFGQSGTSAMELFVDGRCEILARYPNAGWMVISSIPGGQKGKTLTADIDAARLQRWMRESDPWLYGYWFHGWADRFLPVKSIDVASQTFTVDEIDGYGLRKGQRFFARNLLCELDSPGEYYIDRERGKLFLYPRNTACFEAMVSTFETSIFKLENANGVRISGLSIEVGRGGGIEVKNSRSVSLVACRVRNVGGRGIFVFGGDGCVVRSCEIYGTGSSGIGIDGGDRKSLTPGNHLAEQNHIHQVSRLRRTYTPAISVSGVANRVANNQLHHVPHQAISFDGNDHIIELNEIHHAVLETDDAGAIYTCPRDFTSRGTIIRQNHLHHCGPRFAPKVPTSLRTEKHVVYDPMHIHGTSLIYLDDLTGGMVIEGNVLEDGYRAMLIGGGRDNMIAGNLILGGNIGIWIDGRGLGWAAKHVAKGGPHGFYRKFAAIGGDQPPYVTRYPGLKTVLKDHPSAPVNTVVKSNIVIAAKSWKTTDGKSDPYIRFLQNDYIPRSKLPAGASAQQQLEALGSVTEHTAGFKKIPFDQIGRSKKSDLFD